MPAQQPLPFALAQAESDARRNNLGLFILRIGGDLAMRELLMKVFYHQEKTGEPLVKTYEELAQRPWGLCCHVDTVRRLVRSLERWGVLLRHEERYVNDGQKANALELDHAGVAAALNLSQKPCKRATGHPDRGPGVQFAPLPQNAPTSVQNAPTSVQNALPYKEHFLLPSFSNTSSSVGSSRATTAIAPVDAVPDGWEEAAEVLKRLEIGTYQTLLSQAQAAGETPPEFLARVERGERTIRHPANRPRLTSPGGALAKWLRDGVWPVAGLVDPNASCATRAQAPKRSSGIDPETEALLLAKRLRSQGYSDGKIRAAQRGRGLPEVIPYRKET